MLSSAQAWCNPANLSIPLVTHDAQCKWPQEGGEHVILTAPPPHVLNPQKLAKPFQLPCEVRLNLLVLQMRRLRHTELKKLVQKCSTV